MRYDHKPRSGNRWIFKSIAPAVIVSLLAGNFFAGAAESTPNPKCAHALRNVVLHNKLKPDDKTWNLAMDLCDRGLFKEANAVLKQSNDSGREPPRVSDSARDECRKKVRSFIKKHGSRLNVSKRGMDKSDAACDKGDTKTAIAAVNVLAPPKPPESKVVPRIDLTFDVGLACDEFGNKFTVSWNARNATNVKINGKTVAVEGEKTYKLKRREKSRTIKIVAKNEKYTARDTKEAHRASCQH